MIGTHFVTVAGLDVSCLVDEVALVHGRADTTGQPAASTATISLDLAGTELPIEAEIGAVVEVWTVVAAGADPVARFAGRLTDVSLGWDDAGADTPISGVGNWSPPGRWPTSAAVSSVISLGPPSSTGPASPVSWPGVDPRPGHVRPGDRGGPAP